MKMFYREGDDLFHGELMYLPTASPGMRLIFDDKGNPRKVISLLNPTIVEIGVERMVVECNGVECQFYTTAEWIEPVYRVAEWARA